MTGATRDCVSSFLHRAYDQSGHWPSPFAERTRHHRWLGARRRTTLVQAVFTVPVPATTTFAHRLSTVRSPLRSRASDPHKFWPALACYDGAIDREVWTARARRQD